MCFMSNSKDMLNSILNFYYVAYIICREILKKKKEKKLK